MAGKDSNTIGTINSVVKAVPVVGSIASGVIGAVGSLLSGKDKTKNTPGLNDYIASVNSPDGRGTDWIGHRVIGTDELMSWWASHSNQIGWLPVGNPQSYLQPPAAPMYLFPNGALSMSADSFVPFSGSPQTAAGAAKAIASIDEQLGGPSSDYAKAARAAVGTVTRSGSGAPTGSTEPILAGFPTSGSAAPILMLVLLLGGLALLFGGRRG